MINDILPQEMGAQLLKTSGMQRIGQLAVLYLLYYILGYL